ncbi:MAG TPA: hypothetical protein VFB22_01920 [Candidatus Baltobacteraceae bacterium]|nr:hypothetical protein [Candidatus Baltobacteraceae bacterium]
MKRYVFPIADIVAAAREHINYGPIRTRDGSAETLAQFLRGAGVDVQVEERGDAIALLARNPEAASRLEFACVCYLAAAGYRNEARSWIGKATR